MIILRLYRLQSYFKKAYLAIISSFRKEKKCGKNINVHKEKILTIGKERKEGFEDECSLWLN